MQVQYALRLSGGETVAQRAGFTGLVAWAGEVMGYLVAM